MHNMSNRYGDIAYKSDLFSNILSATRVLLELLSHAASSIPILQSVVDTVLGIVQCVQVRSIYIM